MTDKTRKPEPVRAAPANDGDVPRESSASDGVVIRYPGADGIAVVLRASGVVRVGDMRPGKTYIVDPREALRLVDVKGFAFASIQDEDKATALRAALSQPIAAAVSLQPEGGGPLGDPRHRGGTPISNDEE